MGIYCIEEALVTKVIIIRMFVNEGGQIEQKSINVNSISAETNEQINQFLIHTTENRYFKMS